MAQTETIAVLLHDVQEFIHHALCVMCQEAGVVGAAADGAGERARCALHAAVHAGGQEHPAGEAARRGFSAPAPKTHRYIVTNHPSAQS